MGRPLGQKVGDLGLSVRKNAASRGRSRFCNGQSLCSRFCSKRFCAKVEFSRAASHQYSTAREARRCHTQQSDRKNHSGKLSAASGSFARGNVLGRVLFFVQSSSRSAPGSVKSGRLRSRICKGQSLRLQPTTCQ